MGKMEIYHDNMSCEGEKEESNYASQMGKICT